MQVGCCACDLCFTSPTVRCAVSGCNGNALQNQLSGTFSPATFSASGARLPASLKQLDLSYNPHLSGPLPPAGATFTDLQEIVRTPAVTRAAVIGSCSCIFSFSFASGRPAADSIFFFLFRIFLFLGFFFFLVSFFPLLLSSLFRTSPARACRPACRLRGARSARCSTSPSPTRRSSARSPSTRRERSATEAETDAAAMAAADVRADGRGSFEHAAAARRLRQRHRHRQGVPTAAPRRDSGHGCA